MLNLKILFGIFILSFGLGTCSIMLSYMKRLYISEMVSHSVLPGISLGMFILLSVGGFSSHFNDSIILMFCLAYILLIKRLNLSNSCNSYSIVATSGSVGLSLILNTMLQSTFPEYLRFPFSYINGNISLLSWKSIGLYSFFSFVFAIISFIFSSKLELLFFDKKFLEKNEINSEILINILVSVISIFIIFGIMSLGLVLTSVIVTLSAICTKMSVKSFKNQLYLSGVLSGFVSAIGVIFSDCIESKFGLLHFSKSALISICIVPFLFIFLFFGLESQYGIYRLVNRFKKKNTIIEEDFLLYLYKFDGCLKETSLPNSLGNSFFHVKLMLYRLKRNGMIYSLKGCIRITKKGKNLVTSLLEKHEYLENKLKNSIKISSSDAHDVADDLEHFLKSIE